ncbi:MAG: ASKHA domain-containing protein, partial [Planctomycetes bacterium]|nr:ASKHA domain-containing protein [Planctomycetota bacterium]
VYGDLHVSVSPRTELADVAARQPLVGKMVAADFTGTVEVLIAEAEMTHGYLVSGGVVTRAVAMRGEQAVAGATTELGQGGVKIERLIVVGEQPKIGALNVSDDATRHTIPDDHASRAASLALGAGFAESRRPQALLSLHGSGSVLLASRAKLLFAPLGGARILSGEGIQCGVPPVPGAIDSVQIVPMQVRMLLTTVREESPIGLCAGGMFDAVYQLAMTGVARTDGRFSESRTTRTRPDGVREVVLAGPGTPALSPGGIILEPQTPVVFSEQDFAAVLTAKGRVTATLILALEAFGEMPHKLLVDTGGDAGVNPETLYALGLSVGLEPDAIEIIGDAMGLGAVIAGVSAQPERALGEIQKSVRVLDVEADPRFSALARQHARVE